MYSCTRLEVILVAGVRVRSWGLFQVQAKLVTGATARRVVPRDPSIQVFASKDLGLKGSWDPGIQIIPTLSPKVCKCYLHWDIWILKDLVIMRNAI